MSSSGNCSPPWIKHAERYADRLALPLSSVKVTPRATHHEYRVIRNDCRGFNNLSPRSPEAIPCDFFLWGYVKDQVYVPPLPRKYHGTEGTNQNRH